MRLIELKTPGPELDALKNPNPKIRKAALIALDQMDSSPLAASQLTPLLSDKDKELRTAALWVAAHHPDWSGSVLELPRWPPALAWISGRWRGVRARRRTFVLFRRRRAKNRQRSARRFRGGRQARAVPARHHRSLRAEGISSGVDRAPRWPARPRHAGSAAARAESGTRAADYRPRRSPGKDRVQRGFDRPTCGRQRWPSSCVGTRVSTIRP